MILKRSPKNCILCETWIFFKAPICRKCRRFLYTEFLRTEFAIKPMFNHPCYYLWLWTDKNHIWIQKIIISMKNGHNYELYKIFMPWLLKKLEAFEKIKFVAAVPSCDRLHPEALLKSFNQIQIDTNLIQVKKSKNSISQKNRARSQRLKAAFELGDKGQLKLGPTNNCILILDDVLATGGSFKGILNLLGEDKVLALAVWAYKAPRSG